MFDNFSFTTVSVLSLLSLACMVTSSLIKGKKMVLILVFVCLGNALASISYFLSGVESYAGGIACGIGAVTTLINATFQMRGKSIPMSLIAGYAIIYAIPQLYLYFDSFAWPTLISLVASVSFTLCIGQENGRGYRIFTVLNMLLWCTYDLCAPSYDVLFMTHLPLLLFTLAGMLIYDNKKQKKK